MSMKTIEKEKMMAGELYDANDALLATERETCKMQCFTYNNLNPTQRAEKSILLRELLGSTPDTEITIEPQFWCDYGYNISVGKNFYANHNLVILDGAPVSFGDNVFIAPNCSFYTATHPLDAEQRNRGLETAHPITIGNNVWIGGGVTVLPGVSIGDGTVIGAGSVVTRSIPAGVVAHGNPCRVVREIEEQE